MDRAVLREIHRYWFGDLKGPHDIPPEDRRKLWFQPTEEVDQHIRDTWQRYLEPAKQTDWKLADMSREEKAGLIILLDQFPRQIWRKTGEAFAYDAKAREIARELMADGAGDFYPVERNFLYLPFEHSETMADQDYSVRLYAAETMAAPEERKKDMRMALDYALKHWQIIYKFGRFPHRNAMLGRESTPEELEFLKGGRGF